MWLLGLLTLQLKQMDFISLVTGELHRSLRNTRMKFYWTQTGWRKMKGTYIRQQWYFLLSQINSITKKAMIRGLMMDLKISWDSPRPTWWPANISANISFRSVTNQSEGDQGTWSRALEQIGWQFISSKSGWLESWMTVYIVKYKFNFRLKSCFYIKMANNSWQINGHHKII